MSVVAVSHHVTWAHQVHHFLGLRGSETDMRHQWKLELVAQLSGNFEKRQAILAVHIRTHLDLNAQDDVAVCLCCFPRPTHHALNVFDWIDVWVAAAWV